MTPREELAELRKALKAKRKQFKLDAQIRSRRSKGGINRYAVYLTR